MAGLYDRTVHGQTADGTAEIVRYDRAGKWYIEQINARKRRLVTIKDAAHAAALGVAFLGRPGGQRFDALVRRELEQDTDGTRG